MDSPLSSGPAPSKPATSTSVSAGGIRSHAAAPFPAGSIATVGKTGFPAGSDRVWLGPNAAPATRDAPSIRSIPRRQTSVAAPCGLTARAGSVRSMPGSENVPSGVHVDVSAARPAVWRAWGSVPAGNLRCQAATGLP
jgi:hypothetical protein